MFLPTNSHKCLFDGVNVTDRQSYFQFCNISMDCNKNNPNVFFSDSYRHVYQNLENTYLFCICPDMGIEHIKDSENQALSIEGLWTSFTFNFIIYFVFVIIDAIIYISTL